MLSHLRALWACLYLYSLLVAIYWWATYTNIGETMFAHLLYLWSCNLGSKSQLSVNVCKYLGPRGDQYLLRILQLVLWCKFHGTTWILNKLLEAFNCVRGAVQWKPNFQSPTKPSAAETCKLNWLSNVVCALDPNVVCALEPTKWIHTKVKNIAFCSTRNSSSTARVSCKFKRFLQTSNSFIRSPLRCTTGAFDYSYNPQYSTDHDIVCIAHYDYAQFPLLMWLTA